jgi:phenylacetate-coenzyme A ligase PaaK-like adenylate-forming protein
MDVLTKIREEQLENTISGPVQTPGEALSDSPTSLEEGMVFETTGSTGSPKQIPCRNTDHVIGSMVEAFSLAGIEDDVILNLGAPLPHISAWGFRQAIDRLGGRSANQHFRDYQAVIEDGSASEVTTLIAAPSIARAIGGRIAEEYGPPTEVFPNLDRILGGADLVTAARRDVLHDLWGVETIRETYATTEFNAIATTVDETREKIPLLHRFVLEIIPDEHPDEIVDIREVTEETRGSILITAPDREAVDFTRYRIGDKVAVEPGDEIPRITVLGREDDSINLSGVFLYPAQIHEAVRETFGSGADWVARVSEREYPAVDFYIVDGKPRDADQFRARLFEQNSPVEQAYHDVGVIEYLDVHHVDTREEVPGLSSEGGMKQRNVVFDDSYTGEIAE